VLLVDGNNVIGSVPDGWWRDRPGAVRRLMDRLLHFVRATSEPLHVVFDVAQPELPEGDHDGVVVHYATRRGRDAADDRILELLDAGFDTPIEVVTSDRRLAEGCVARGATVVGAGTLLDRLAEAGC
jgi:predicted RNA-binding protein with PIN domain